MDAEDDLFRSPALRPYQPVATQLRVPVAALDATLRLLSSVGKRESGLFWYGPRDSAGNGLVAYVVAPRQRMSWGNYSVTPEALAEVVHRLQEQWKPLAQVHSHPGLSVEHSVYDDQIVSSRRALSIVFPRYGHWAEPFPVGVGVHEWQNDYWYLLDLAAAQRRIVRAESSVEVDDLR